MRKKNSSYTFISLIIHKCEQFGLSVQVSIECFVLQNIFYMKRVSKYFDLLAGWIGHKMYIDIYIVKIILERHIFFGHILLHMYYALNTSLYTIYWTLLRTLRLHMYEYKYIAGIVMIKHCCGDTRASDFYEKGHFYFYIYCIRVEWKWDCENCAMAPKGKK